MNDLIFEQITVLLVLAALSAAAIVRLGLATQPGRIPFVVRWQQAWNRGCAEIWFVRPGATPSDCWWAGGSLAVGWLAAFAIPWGAPGASALAWLSATQQPHWQLLAGLILLSDWLGRQSGRGEGACLIPWQGWLWLAALAGPLAWQSSAADAGTDLAWCGLWFPAAVAVWLLACSLKDLDDAHGLARLAAVIRRWTLLAAGCDLFFGGGALPGGIELPLGGEHAAWLAKILLADWMLTYGPELVTTFLQQIPAMLTAIVLGVAGGPLVYALQSTVGRDRSLLAVAQFLMLVAGVWWIRSQSARRESQTVASDTSAAVG